MSSAQEPPRTEEEKTPEELREDIAQARDDLGDTGRGARG